MSDEDALSEQEKQLLRTEMKRALEGRLEGMTAGLSSACFGFWLVESGVIPFLPPINPTRAIGLAIFFGAVTLILYYYRTRPHKRRVDELINEMDARQGGAG